MQTRISAASYYLPENKISTTELENRLIHENPHIKFVPGLISQITKIDSRQYAHAHEYSSTLAIKACNKLFDENSVKPDQIELLIFASAGQDLVEPATSHIVQNALGTACPVMDIKNACNSFLNALEVADSFIKQGKYKKILICTGEKSSVGVKFKLKDKDDFRNSFAGYTFGDAGSAVLFEASEDNESRIIYSKFTAMSKYWSVGTLPGGGSRHPRGDEFTYFHGSGADLRDAFDELGPDLILDSLQSTGFEFSDFKRIFVHQVSLPMLQVFLKSAGIDKDKILVTVVEYGNMAAATIPVGLAMSLEQGQISRGDKIMMIGLAGGVSLGVTILQY
ncbi:MAG: ketoacyl-ACP synthase III [bacterium]